MIKKFNKFQAINEWSISEEPERFGAQIIDRCLSRDFITKEESISQQTIDVANEIAWEHKDDDEIGSSDMTYIMKDFLDGIGKKTDFVENRLVVVNDEPPTSTTVESLNHIKLYEYFYTSRGQEEDPLGPLMGNTYRTHDNYQVYFDDNYIELIDQTGEKIVTQFEYPDEGETVESDGYELFYADDTAYFEFIKDGRIVTTLYLSDEELDQVEVDLS